MLKTDAPAQLRHFVKAVATALRRRCGVRRGQRMVVAISGGGDSVALLRALAILADRRIWSLELAVGHVQHHLRDPLWGGEAAAEADAAFVESLAGQLDLPFLREDLDLSTLSMSKDDREVRMGAFERPGSSPHVKRRSSDRSQLGDDGGRNLEARARRMRYQALLAMAEAFGAPWVATAHQADDQLETLLMRILRGAAVSGLRGIASCRPLGACGPSSENRGASATLIRPMLVTTGAEARAFLRRLDQPWREDHTNADVSRVRARLRHEVLPVLRGIRSDVAAKAVSLTDHLRAVHLLIESEVDRHHERVVRDGDSVSLDRGEARLMNRAVMVALLRRLLGEAGVGQDRLGLRALNPIARAIRDTTGGQRTFKLTCRAIVQVRRETVQIRVDPLL